VPIRTFVVAAAIASAVVAVAGVARSAQVGVICGQIKHGPYASYRSSVSGVREQGTTWTVIATGLPCATALKATPALLEQWAKAKIGGPLTLSGMHCLKMADGAYSGSGTSSGGFVCGSQAGTPYIFAPKTFAARMTGVWSIAVIKQYFGLG
jgi:hypothetical protein